MRALLVVYDNDSYMHWFPQGLAYIASALRSEGVKVDIYSQDIHHYPEDHLTEHLNRNHYDLIGLSFVAGYYQYRKALKISEAINRAEDRPFFVLGGHGPSPEPEFFLSRTGADAVVIGEGEETVVELIRALAAKRELSQVQGIAYRIGSEVTVNERRSLIRDIDKIEAPAYDLFPIEIYRLQRLPHAASSDFVLPVLSGRGCTFQCTFCYRMDQGFRPRSNESVIEEIKLLQKDYRISYIGFADELLMSSIERTESLCNDFLKHKLNIKWECNGRLNYARPDLLRLMRKAGCVFINYGIEALDDKVLRNMKKALTVKQIEKGIGATMASGISPGFNIIFGNIGDNRDTLQRGVDFLLRYDDGAQLRTIRPVTPYPGSPLYDHAIEEGLLKDCRDFYENKHTNSDLLSVNFTKMSDEEFYQALHEANSSLLENYFKKRAQAGAEQLADLYIRNDDSFRGFRQT